MIGNAIWEVHYHLPIQIEDALWQVDPQRAESPQKIHLDVDCRLSTVHLNAEHSALMVVATNP